MEWREQTKKRVGRRILDAMNARDMNQTALANRLGKSLTQVGRYISGETDIPLTELENIARVLNVEMWQLVGAEPPNPDNIAGDAFNKLRPEHKAAVRALIDHYRSQEAG